MPPKHSETQSRPGNLRAEAGLGLAPAPNATVALDQTCELFRLAADPTRLQILLFLEHGERTVSELIAEFSGFSDQYVSRHLGHLRHAGLVDDQVARQFRIYSLTDAGRRLARAVGPLMRR